jgi:hypothetical protein
VLSYARHAGDVVLARVFGGQPSGVYVDVGAGPPEAGSVTQPFYERGWRGVNVTPSPAAHARLSEARPRDVNLRLALSDRPIETDVALRTLADVCARHAAGPIDFLRIDAEGGAETVIRGGDWARHRPRVVLVEAAERGSGAPDPTAGEPLLLAAGYRLALFDGRSRFYARAEDAALLPCLAAVADGVEDPREPPRDLARIAELERHRAGLGQQVAELEARAAEWKRRATDVRRELEGCQAWTKVLEGKVRRLEEHIGLLPGTLPPPPAAYTREAFVRFLYAALLNRSDALPAHVAHWANRLQAGATMLELFEAFLATPEGHHVFWTNPFFQRYLRPAPPALAFADVPELAAHLGVVRVVDVGATPVADGPDVYRPLARAGRCEVVACGARPSPDRPPVRLDDLDACREAAVCRLDAPGAALDVLRGAPRLLRELLVLHVAVEFAPHRERRALFADVDAHLRAAGFELHALPRLEHERYDGAGPVNGGRPSRLLRADAVFVPTRERILALPVERALPLCWVMHELYRAYDFCRWLLASLDAGGRTPSFVRAYDRVLGSIPR